MFGYLPEFEGFFSLMFTDDIEYIFIVVCSSLPPTPQSKLPQHQLIGKIMHLMKIKSWNF